MSEITKACKTCNDTRKVSSDAWEAPPARCPDCITPTDEERITALNIAVERFDHALRVKESENAALRAQLRDVTTERDALRESQAQPRQALIPVPARVRVRYRPGQRVHVMVQVQPGDSLQVQVCNPDGSATDAPFNFTAEEA